ncbi:MAG: hypothetical protein COT06_07680, partial [Syntrophobacteraceae bacterium CG07_land_8_20_14_0_80_61_8]
MVRLPTAAPVAACRGGPDVPAAGIPAAEPILIRAASGNLTVPEAAGDRAGRRPPRFMIAPGGRSAAQPFDLSPIQVPVPS